MSDTMRAASCMSERGALLTFALATAVISSIAAYAALVVATSQARQGRVLQQRPSATYAAEAGVVVAREILWRNPTYTGETKMLDMNADGVAETQVTITVTPLNPLEPLGRRRIEARVIY